MLDRSTALHVPHQAAPLNRAVSSAALDGDRGADADFFKPPLPATG